MFLERIVPILISIETTVIHPDAILFQITLFITGPKQTDGDLEHVVETCWPCIGNRSRNMEILESGSVWCSFDDELIQVSVWKRRLMLQHFRPTASHT